MFNYSDTGVDSLLSLSPRTAIIFEIIHVRKLLVVFEFVVFHRRKQYQRQRVFEFERISTSNTDSRSALFSCVIAHPLEVVGLNTSFVTKRQVTPGVSAWSGALWRRKKNKKNKRNTIPLGFPTPSPSNFIESLWNLADFDIFCFVLSLENIPLLCDEIDSQSR